MAFQATRDFPQPDTQRKLRRFIGMVNFYHHFLPRCAELMQPLHNLLTPLKSKSQTLKWNDTALAAFNSTKDALANASLLYYPAPTCVMTDASDKAVGAVLQQYVQDTWQLAEMRYSTFDRELLAICLAIKHFRHFLEGRQFHHILSLLLMPYTPAWTDTHPVKPANWTIYRSSHQQSDTSRARITQ